MKSEKLYEILEDIREDYVKEAEEYTEKHRRIKINKVTLVAAILAIILCGTAAAAGLMWLVPKIQEEENGFSLVYDGGYFELSDETVQALNETWGIGGESGEMRLMVFESFRDWQNFFDIPFAMGDYVNHDEKEKLSEYENGAFVMGKYLDTAVIMKNKNGEFTPYSMSCGIPVGLYHYDENHILKYVCDWSGNIQVIVPLCKEAAKELKKTYYHDEARTHEFVEEYSTPSGIPCVITKTYYDSSMYNKESKNETNDPNVRDIDHSIVIALHYGHDSAIYSISDSVYVLEDGVYPTEEVDALIAKLKEIVNGFTIQYPAE